MRSGIPSPANIRIGSSPSRRYGIHAGGVRIGAGEVLAHQEPEQVAPAREPRRGDLRHLQPAEGATVVLAGDRSSTNVVAERLGGDALALLRPGSKQRERLAAEGVECPVVAGAQRVEHRIGGRGTGRIERRGQLGVPERAERLVEVLSQVGLGRQRLDTRPDAAALGGDLGQVAGARDRDHRGAARLAQVEVGRRLPRRGVFAGMLGQLGTQSEEDAVHARIAELARDRREHRKLVVGRAERDPIPPPLLAHVPQRIVGAALVRLVDDDHRCEVEHVDLLELARRAVLACHHVQRDVREVDDLRIALPDPRRLDEDEPEALRAQERDGRGEHRVGRQMPPPRRDRAHEDAVAAQAVHPDPVAEERATCSAARRVDGDHGHAEIREVGEEPGQDLVRHGALAGAAGARDPDDGNTRALLGPVGLEERELGRVDRPVLERRQHLRHGEVVTVTRHIGNLRRPLRCVRALDEVVDHPGEAELQPVGRRVDPLDPVRLELRRLGCRDRAAAAAEDANMRGTRLAEHVDRVAEVLDVPTLIRADRDRVRIFLDRRTHDIRDAAVVAEVDHLRPRRLDQPAHYVDRSVVSVEQ